MINEDMKVDGMLNGIIARRSEGAEAARKRRESVVSEDFDGESEVGGSVGIKQEVFGIFGIVWRKQSVESGVEEEDGERKEKKNGEKMLLLRHRWNHHYLLLLCGLKEKVGLMETHLEI